jgi:uncharacterized protein
MMSTAELRSNLALPTVIDAQLGSVASIYDRVARDQAGFLRAAASRGRPLDCPPGCGACCRPFVPDILPSEAAYAAAWMLDNDPELAREIASWPRERPATPPCPFLAPSAAGERCSIYPARFLVCRLFCASGIRDKEGRVAYRPCASMPFAGYPPPGSARPQLVGPAIAEAFGAEPPVMADYASALVALSPSESSERRSLFEALPSAIARVGLARSLAAATSDGPYSLLDESAS